MRPLETVQNYIGDGLAVCAFVLLAAMVSVEILKPWLRARLQKQHLAMWVERSAGLGADLSSLAKAAPDWLVTFIGEDKIGSIQFRLKQSFDELPYSRETWEPIDRRGPMGNATFMRLVQNQAASLLESPLRDPHRFGALTRGAPERDRIAALYLHALRRFDPVLLANLVEVREEKPGHPSALIVAASRSNLAAAAERNLDELQLGLQSAWETRARAIALGAGLVVALLLGIGARVVAPTSLLVAFVPILGLMGGAAAAVLLGRLDDRVIWPIPTWIFLTVIIVATGSSLAFGVWAWVAASSAGWVVLSAGAADLVAVGLIGGAVAPVAYNSLRALLAGRA